MLERNEPEITETLELTNIGVVYVQGEKEHHIKSKYQLVKDEITGDTRVITLKTIDKLDIDRKLSELIDAIAEQVGGSEFAKLVIKDSLDEHFDETIERLHKRVVEDKEPIKRREGCMYLQVGKRHKDFIDIRNSER